MRRISARHCADWFAGSRTLQAIAYWHSKRGTPVAKRPRTRRALSHHAEGHRPWWGGERIRTSTYDFVPTKSTPRTAIIDSRRKGQQTFWRKYGIGEMACLESNNTTHWKAGSSRCFAGQSNRPGRGRLVRRDLMVEDSSVDKLVRRTKSPHAFGYAFPRSAQQESLSRRSIRRINAVWNSGSTSVTALDNGLKSGSGGHAKRIRPYVPSSSPANERASLSG